MGAKLSKSHTSPLINFDKEGYLSDKLARFDNYKQVSRVHTRKNVQRHNQEIGKLLVNPNVKLILKYLDNIKDEYEKEQYLYSYRPAKKIFTKNGIKRRSLNNDGQDDIEYMNIMGIILFSNVSMEVKEELIVEITNMCQSILKLPCICYSSNSNYHSNKLTPIDISINLHYPIVILKSLVDRNMTLKHLADTFHEFINHYPIDLLSPDDKKHIKDFIRNYLSIINYSLTEVGNNIDGYDYDIDIINQIKANIEFSVNTIQSSMDVIPYVDLLSDVTGNLNMLHLAYILRTIGAKSKIKEEEMTIDRLKKVECCVCLSSHREIQPGNKMGITLCGHAICQDCSGSVVDKCHICSNKFDLEQTNIYYYSLNNII